MFLGIGFPRHQAGQVFAGELAAQAAEQRIMRLHAGMDRAAARLRPFLTMTVCFPTAAAQALRFLCTAGAVLSTGGDRIKVGCCIHIDSPFCHYDSSICALLQAGISGRSRRIGLPKKEGWP